MSEEVKVHLNNVASNDKLTAHLTHLTLYRADRIENEHHDDKIIIRNS